MKQKVVSAVKKKQKKNQEQNRSVLVKGTEKKSKARSYAVVGCG